MVVNLDIDELRAEQSHREEDAMIADVTGIFKKLHTTKAGLAVWGHQGFPSLLIKKLNDLEDVRDICRFGSANRR